MDDNITDIIINTINSIVNGLFSSIDNNIYSVLDKITFINSDILNNSYFERIFGTSSSNGILLIANSLLIGFVLYYAANLILANLSITQVQSPLSFIFKTIVFGVFMNSSFFVCEQIINLNSYISIAIQNLGESIFNMEVNFSSLINIINSNVLVDETLNIFTFDGLIKSLISISLFSLLLSYSLRYVMVKVFVLISPFAFLSLSNLRTSWFFKSWFRGFLSLLVLQCLVSLILLMIFSFNYNDSDIFSKLIYVGGIYALIKANSYLKSLIGGISTEVNANISNFKNIAR